MNQFYNKEKAQLQSIYDKQGIKFGTRMSQINSKRNHKIKDMMHKISRYTIDYCLEHNIGTIVIGKNDNWKQESNMGKKKLQQESHTSKCSFLDMEPICHQEIYVGYRFTRGLFKSAKGLIINSDVNGALNIIRKAIPNAFAKGIEDVGLHPVRRNTL
jgi:putative transposase